MSFREFPGQAQVMKLLQRSLDAGRLGHAYLFSGDSLEELQAVGRTLAKTLNCQNPLRGATSGLAVDCCDQCSPCKRIDSEIHPDIQWIRPESKSRIISIDQVRDLMKTVYLKPTEAAYKVAIVCAVDRMNPQSANAFLKTLEEPPARCVFVLLTTNEEAVLETILSRCLRLTFAGGETVLPVEAVEWLKNFGAAAVNDPNGILNRYRLIDVLLKNLGGIRQQIEELLTAQSPLEKYPDAESNLKEKWEVELTAAVESEYRRQRAELMALLQTWFRDVWIHVSTAAQDLLSLPELADTTRIVAQRLSANEAKENLDALEKAQRMLMTNVQESLALEVTFLKLKL